MLKIHDEYDYYMEKIRRQWYLDCMEDIKIYLKGIRDEKIWDDKVQNRCKKIRR